MGGVGRHLGDQLTQMQILHKTFEQRRFVFEENKTFFCSQGEQGRIDLHALVDLPEALVEVRKEVEGVALTLKASEIKELIETVQSRRLGADGVHIILDLDARVVNKQRAIGDIEPPLFEDNF